MSDFHEPAGGYGRIWESMYEGSLAGAGPEVFCLMPYVIAKMRMSKGRAMVLLNPKLLVSIFGGDTDLEFVERGIEKLCAPDPDSKNGRDKEGRRLIRLEGHLYEVVNGVHYMQIRNNERHADAQARYRERKKKQKSEALPGEQAALASGDRKVEDRITAEALPATAVRADFDGEVKAAAHPSKEAEAAAERAALAADVPEVEAGNDGPPDNGEDEDLYRQAPD